MFPEGMKIHWLSNNLIFIGAPAMFLKAGWEAAKPLFLMEIWQNVWQGQSARVADIE